MPIHCANVKKLIIHPISTICYTLLQPSFKGVNYCLSQLTSFWTPQKFFRYLDNLGLRIRTLFILLLY